MKLAIHHETIYRYDERVARTIQYLRLTPQNSAHQRVLSWDLDTPAKTSKSFDAYGNVLHVMALDQPHDEIRITASGIVETDGDSNVLPEEHLNPLLFTRSTPLTECSDAMMAFADKYRKTIQSAPYETQISLIGDLIKHIQYEKGETDSRTPASVAFERGRGVCQDHTQVFLALARYLGVPARYVSGYVLDSQPEHVASHAWAETLIDGVWHGFDVTNQCEPGPNHLKLAIGLDYLDACPVRGMRRGGGLEAMHAIARVSPVDQ